MDSSLDTYLVLTARVDAELPKIRGSRFLASALPAEDERAALAAVQVVRAEQHAARHHCWAYRLNPGGERFRYSDDGEPQGTAGAPLYREIEGCSLTNLVVVVTRYYGGVKLGAGGLARAYGGASRRVLRVAHGEGRIRRMTIREPLQLTYSFEDTAPAMRVLDLYDTKLDGQAYSAEGATLDIRVKRSHVDALCKSFVEATRGRGGITHL